MDDTKRLNWLEKQDGGALINDDDGRWAFASLGVQNVNLTDEEYDLESSWWIEKHAFKSSIREAIDHAITIENNNLIEHID